MSAPGTNKATGLFGTGNSSPSPFGTNSGTNNSSEPPKFSFGNSGSSGLFGTGNKPNPFGSASSTETPKPAAGGLFGQSAKPSLFGSSTQSEKPALFGNSTPDATKDKPAASGFNFSSTTSASASGTNKPLFGSTNTDNSTKPLTFGTGLSFGKPTDGTEKKTEAEKPANAFSFSGFGSSASSSSANQANQANQATPGTSETKPAFSGLGSSGLFGKKPESSSNIGTTNTEKPSTVTGFSFGTNKNESTTTTKTDKPAESSGFSFGAKTGTSSTTSALPSASDKPTGLSFGGNTTNSGFSFGKTEEPKLNTTSGNSEKPASSGFSFGKKDEQKDQQKAEQKETGKTATPGFSFGQKEDTKDGKSTISSSGFSFGKKEDTKDGKSTNSTGFSFGKKEEKEKDEKSTNSSSAASTGFSFGKKEEQQKDSASSVTTKAESVKIEPISFENKSMIEIVSRWKEQLATYSKVFESQAGFLNKADNELYKNSKKIATLYEEVAGLEITQNEIDSVMDSISNDQNYMEKLLEECEEQIDSIMTGEDVNVVNGLVNPLNPSGYIRENTFLVQADQDRLKMGRMAETIDDKLDGLEVTLAGLIKDINSLSEGIVNDNNSSENENSTRFTAGISTSQVRDSSTENGASGTTGGAGNGEPLLVQVMRILNAHLETLKFVDIRSEVFREKIEEIRKEVL